MLALAPLLRVRRDDVVELSCTTATVTRPLDQIKLLSTSPNHCFRYTIPHITITTAPTVSASYSVIFLFVIPRYPKASPQHDFEGGKPSHGPEAEGEGR